MRLGFWAGVRRMDWAVKEEVGVVVKFGGVGGSNLRRERYWFTKRESIEEGNFEVS